MKLLYATLVVIVLIMVACQKKTVPTETVTDVPTTPANPTTPKKETPVDEPKKEAAQIIGFEKTACYGKCPVYKVAFYEDGRVTWYGRMNVKMEGWHEAQAGPGVLKSIISKADEIGFFSMEKEYPVGHRVADLPTTIVFIKKGNEEKQVKDTHDSPQKLQEFEEWLSQLIDGLDWKEKKD